MRITANGVMAALVAALLVDVACYYLTGNLSVTVPVGRVIVAVTVLWALAMALLGATPEPADG